MKIERQIYLGANQCPYAYRGRNLAEMRRCELRKVLREYGFPPDSQAPKQDLLRRLMFMCDSDTFEFSEEGLHKVVK